MTYPQIAKSDNKVITLKDAKSYLKQSFSQDDDQIKAMILGATIMAEKSMNADILTTTYENYRRTFFDDLTLRRGPFQSLEKIEYLKDDVYTLLAATEYTLKIGGIFGCICDLTPPSDMDDSCNAVKITFKTGFGDTGDDVPADIKIALKAHIMFLNENRGDCTDRKNIPTTSEMVYTNYRIIDLVGDSPVDIV